jgi:hypothetical protein
MEFLAHWPISLSASDVQLSMRNPNARGLTRAEFFLREALRTSEASGDLGTHPRQIVRQLSMMPARTPNGSWWR